MAIFKRFFASVQVSTFFWKTNTFNLKIGCHISKMRCRFLVVNSQRSITTSSVNKSLVWNYTSDEILSKAEKLIEDTKAIYDEIGAIPLSEVSFENTVKRIADTDCEYAVARDVLDFYQHVHPNKNLRDASTTADKKISDFEVDVSMRQDIHDRIVAVSKMKDMKLSPEDERFIERMIKIGVQNGLNLETDVQAKIKDIKKRMTELCIDFNKNLNEEASTLCFSREELKGMSEDFIKSLEEKGGKFAVTLKYPHYFPIMKKCSVSQTRRAIEKAFNCRCKNENCAYLAELIKLRAEKAAILGFENHAAFVLDMRMAKSPRNVQQFLKDLAEQLKPLGNSDISTMLKLKQDHCKSNGEKFDGKINMWDLRYYCTKIEEENYAVDQQKLKEYFPMETVTEGLLSIYQELLQLKFEKVQDCHVWHEDVSLYAVRDANHGGVIGHFYLDLFPRQGKYGHAACFRLVPGCLKADGSRQHAVAAMVANFTKPVGDSPSLLLHDEVETYFHEFGHVMHQICAEAKYEMFSGTRVERDFVEAPSQMLENWCWETESLRRMSGHYKDNSELPAEMVEKLVKSRNANCGVFYLRQVALATLDQRIHTLENADATQVYAEVCNDILGIPATPDTAMPATFTHLAGGYDAQYYGYLWSEVFCFDMFYSRFKKEGIMSSAVGKDYRDKILRPGGSIDATEMLRNFLGRDPNQEAFLAAKGLRKNKL